MVSKASATKGSSQAIDYLLDDKGQAVEIDRQGIAGQNGLEILSEFREIQAMNSRCQNNTYSIVLSPSNERNFELSELREIGRKHLKNLGLENNQYLMTVHTSTDQPHIHIQVNRIGFNGRAHDDKFIGKYAQLSAEKIAKEYGLTTAKDIAKIKNLQHTPIKQEIEQANQFAMKNARTFTQYKDLMHSKGIEVNPTINSKGEMQGFRIFHKQSGLDFKASEVKGVGLKYLPKNGIKLDIPVTPNFANLAVKTVKAVTKEVFKGRGLGM